MLEKAMSKHNPCVLDQHEEKNDNQCPMSEFRVSRNHC